MLSPASPFVGQLDVIATADIETDKDGRLLDVNLAYGEVYQTCASWWEWLECVRMAYETAKVGRVWFHNGGRFDVVNLAVAILRGELAGLVESYDLRTIDGTIIEARLKLVGLKKMVRIGDSFRLMPYALDQLGKGLGLDGKDYVPDEFKSDMGRYKREHEDAYRKYHKRDTLLLLRVLETFRANLAKLAEVGNLRLTCAATAMAVFRTGFLGEDIVTPGKKERDFTRLAYQGGRTEYFGDGDLRSGTRATYDGVSTYDMNSQYPRMMRDNLFPVSRGFHTTRERLMRDDEGRIRPGCYRASFWQKHGHIAIIKPKMGPVPAKEGAWSGETHATYIELREIEEHGGRVVLHEGVVYRDRDMKPIFREFVEKLYAWRLLAASAGDEAMKTVVKLIMNNLYGKFGQGESGERVAMLTPAEVLVLVTGEHPAVVRELEFFEGAYTIEEEIQVPHAFPAIAAFITAHARLALLYPANHLGVRYIYGDTDSVHTQDPMPAELVSQSELGSFKLEDQDTSKQYAGRKLYRDIGSGKIRAKGIPKKAHDARLFNAAAEEGTPWKAPYQAPMGIRSATRKNVANPSKFEDYTRTVTASPSTRELGLLR